MSSIKPLDGGKHAGRAKRDLTPFQWHAASVVSAAQGPANMLESDDVIDVAAGTADAVGILEYPGNMQGKPTHIIVAGRGKLKMTGTGSAGASVGIENGKGTAASDGEDAYCRALDNWADGDVCPVYIDKHTAGTPGADFVPPVEPRDGLPPILAVFNTTYGPTALNMGESQTYIFEAPGTSTSIVTSQAGAGGRVSMIIESADAMNIYGFSENQSGQASGPGLVAGPVKVTVLATEQSNAGFAFSLDANFQ